MYIFTIFLYFSYYDTILTTRYTIYGYYATYITILTTHPYAYYATTLGVYINLSWTCASRSAIFLYF